MEAMEANVSFYYIYKYIRSQGRQQDCVQQTNKQRKGKDESNTKIRVREKDNRKEKR